MYTYMRQKFLISLYNGLATALALTLEDLPGL